MEWRKSGNGSKTKPEAVQFDYNCDTVYVRKDFEKHEGNKELNLPECWTYSEIKIPLQDWEYWKQLMEQKQEIVEAQEAAVELAGNTVNQNSMIEELQAAIAELGVMTGVN